MASQIGKFELVHVPVHTNAPISVSLTAAAAPPSAAAAAGISANMLTEYLESQAISQKRPSTITGATVDWLRTNDGVSPRGNREQQRATITPPGGSVTLAGCPAYSPPPRSRT